MKPPLVALPAFLARSPGPAGGESWGGRGLSRDRLTAGRVAACPRKGVDGAARGRGQLWRGRGSRRRGGGGGRRRGSRLEEGSGEAAEAGGAAPGLPLPRHRQPTGP